MPIARQRRRKADIPVDEAVYRLRLADKLPVPKKRFCLIDLFSGAGGFTLGFTEKFGHSFKLHSGRSPTAPSVKRYKARLSRGMNRFDLQQ